MKNFKCWITMFILLIFASCGEDNPVNDNVKPDVPQTEPDKIEFANAADKNLAFDCIESSKEIKFKTNVAWKIMVPSDVESWLSVNPSSGTKGDASVSIAAKGNEEYEGRSAELTLVAGSKKEKISVFQIQKDAIVIASPNYEIAAEGGEILIEIGHNVDFDISIEADWLKQSTTKAFVKESLRFVASENTTKEARDGKIVFSNKEKSITQTVNVHQAKRENLEREALIALYKATNGDNWVHNENWCSEKPLSEWYGVKTNQEFSGVYVLDLAKNNLTGDRKSVV